MDRHVAHTIYEITMKSDWNYSFSLKILSRTIWTWLMARLLNDREITLPSENKQNIYLGCIYMIHRKNVNISFQSVYIKKTTLLAKHWKITKTLYPILSLKYLLKVRQYDWNKVFVVSFVMFNFLGDTLTLVYSQRLKIKTKYNRHLTLIRLKVVEPF